MRSFVIVVALAVAAAVPLSAQQQDPLSDGELLFQLVCAMCHSVEPPMKTAPSMSHVSAFYLREYEDFEAAVTAMVDFLKEPTVERSVIPAMAIEQFGLMPAQAHLSDAQLEAVARYVLELADMTHVEDDRGHGQRD